MVVCLITAVSDFDPGNVVNANNTVSTARTDGDIAELFRCQQLTFCANRINQLLIISRRRRTDFTGSVLIVLLFDRFAHIDGRNAELSHFLRIQPNTHRALCVTENVCVTDAGDAFDCIHYVQIHVVSELNRF